jgi:hypothetical protein
MREGFEGPVFEISSWQCVASSSNPPPFLPPEKTFSVNGSFSMLACGLLDLSISWPASNKEEENVALH